MGFLIKTTFWFSLVLLALPLDMGVKSDGERQVGAIEALIAAGEAVTDIAGMCERKPGVCETGKSAISTIGTRARIASRIAYDSMEQKQEELPAVAVAEEMDHTVTGTIPDTVDVLPAPAPRAR